MEDSLFLSDALSVEEQLRIPNETFFVPDSFKRTSEKQRVWQTVSGADSVVISDADLDGLAAAATHFKVFENSVFVSGGPHAGLVSTNEALYAVANAANNGVTVTVADIGVTDSADVEALEDVAEVASEIYWCDHHQWTDDARQFVDEYTTRLEVDDREDSITEQNGERVIEENARCAAQVVADVLEEETEYKFSESYRHSLKTVAARDLWRKDEAGDFIYDETEPLNAFAQSVAWDAASPYNETSYLSFIERFADCGVDVLSLESVQNRVERNQNTVTEQSNQFFELFENNDEFSTTGVLDINGQSVETVIVYGRFPTSEVSDKLRRDYGYDLVVTLTPTGGLSLRSSDDIPYCHIIAQELFDGGGHPSASGGKAPIEFETIVDYIEYWDTAAEEQREIVYEQISELENAVFEDST